MTREQQEGLAYLLRVARKVHMGEAELAEQRRSFAYGNAAFENAKITREMVDSEDRKIQVAD